MSVNFSNLNLTPTDSRSSRNAKHEEHKIATRHIILKFLKTKGKNKPKNNPSKAGKDKMTTNISSDTI